MARKEKEMGELIADVITSADNLVATILQDPVPDSSLNLWEYLHLNIKSVKDRTDLATARQFAQQPLSTVLTALQSEAVDEEYLLHIQHEEIQHGSGYTISGVIARTVEELGVYSQTHDLMVEASRHSGLPIRPLVDTSFNVFFSGNQEEEEEKVQNRDQGIALLGDMIKQQTVLPDSIQKVNRVVLLVAAAIEFSSAEDLRTQSSVERMQRIKDAIVSSSTLIQDADLKEQAIEKLRRVTHMAEFQQRLDRISQGIADFSTTSQ